MDSEAKRLSEKLNDVVAAMRRDDNSAMWMIRDIAEVSAVLAEASEGLRGDDVILPERLYNEINATGAAWKERAEAAEAEVKSLRMLTCKCVENNASAEGLRAALQQAASDLKSYGHHAAAGRARAALSGAVTAGEGQ